MGGIDPHTVCDVTAGAWEPAVTGVSGGNSKEKPAMGKPVFTMEGALHAKERQGESLGGASSPGPATDGSRQSNLEPVQCGQGG